MKKLIETGSKIVETVNINNIDTRKFIVGKHKIHTLILFVPKNFKSNQYFARALDNTFAYGNGYGNREYSMTITEWVVFFKGDVTFYQLDTLKEVFEFAFE